MRVKLGEDSMRNGEYLGYAVPLSLSLYLTLSLSKLLLLLITHPK